MRILCLLVLLVSLPLGNVYAQDKNERDLAHLLASFSRYHLAIEKQTSSPDAGAKDLRAIFRRHIGLDAADYERLTSLLARRPSPAVTSREASRSERILAFQKREESYFEALRDLRSNLSPSGMKAIERYLLDTYRASLVAVPMVSK